MNSDHPAGLSQWMFWCEIALPHIDSRKECQRLAELATAKSEDEGQGKVQDVNVFNIYIPKTLSFYCKNIVDEKLKELLNTLMDRSLTLEEKLLRVDRILPIPPERSSYEIAEYFGVAQSSVIRTEWWRARQKKKRDDAAEAIYKRMKHYENTRPSPWGE